MKVFKFFSNDLYWAYSGKTEDEAREKLFNDEGSILIKKSEEIPESEWDEKIISIYEDNDFGKEPFKVSIREQISSTPELLFTNDISRF